MGYLMYKIAASKADILNQSISKHRPSSRNTTQAGWSSMGRTGTGVNRVLRNMQGKLTE
jgi:hypothetical protein